MTVTFNRIDNDPLIGIVATLVLTDPTEAELEQAIADFKANTPVGQHYRVTTETPDEPILHTSSDKDVLGVGVSAEESVTQVDTTRSISNESTR